MKGDPLWVQLLPQAYQSYGWQPTHVANVRGVVRIQAKKEDVALKPIKADSSRLQFLDRMNRHLLEQHYVHVLPWIRTKYGDTFFVGSGMAFYATPWFGKEWSRDASISEEALIQSVAQMHQLTDNTHIDWDETHVFTLEKVSKQWDKQLRLIESYREAAQKREYASPFDVAFLAGLDELNQAATFAMNGLKQMSEKEQQKPFRRVFCHRRLHPHNLVYDHDNWKWIDLEHAAIDVPARDLATFIQNFPLQEEGNEDEEIAKLQSRISAYEATFPLNLREKQLLGLLLAYPENVMKWLNRYYRRRRTRDELFYVQGFENALRYFQLLKRFVKQTWPRGETARKPKMVST